METASKLKKTTTRAQQERLVNMLSTKVDVARNFTKRPAEEVATFWESIATELNLLGPPVRDVIGWKKVWSDYKTYIKKKLAENKKEASGTGGGPFKEKSFTPIEEAVIAIINMKDTINGVGARTYGPDAKTNSFPESNDNDHAKENSSSANLQLDYESYGNSDEDDLIAAPSTSRSTKRKPLSTTQLLNRQVHSQETHFKEMSSMLNTANKSLLNCEKHLKRVSRSLDNLCDIEKKKLKEMREHNADMKTLMNRKLELKVRILENEILKTDHMLNAE